MLAQGGVTEDVLVQSFWADKLAVWVKRPNL